MSELRRFILDANVIISALLFKKSLPRQALDKARKQGIVLMSQSIWSEISEVVARPKFDKYISSQERQLFLLVFEQAVRFVDIKETINACRDPKDDKYLELAVNGKAECIVTGDRDLLVLHPFREIPIITVAQFISDRSNSW
ncbi:MAG: putative toxin-antitoxin system toxin component, PIN family [Xenococcaceae cyanobacterium]